MDDYLANWKSCIYGIELDKDKHCKSGSVISEAIELSRKYGEPIKLKLTHVDGLGIAVLNLDDIGLAILQEKSGVEYLVEDAKLCSLCDKHRVN